MPIIVSEFFQRYAEAFNNSDLDAAIDLFGLPSIVMTDERKLIMVKREDVELEIKRVMEKFEDRGVVTFEPTVEQVMKMSDTLRFCNISWSFKGADGNEMFNGEDSFTLQTKDDTFEVVAMVVREDDEVYYQTVEEYGTTNEV
jgi:hypothetical protein